MQREQIDGFEGETINRAAGQRQGAGRSRSGGSPVMPTAVSNDIVMFVNARELRGMHASEIHRLPFIRSLARQTRGKVLVVTHYVSLVSDIWMRSGRLYGRVLYDRVRKIGDNVYVYTPLVTCNLALGRFSKAIENYTRRQMRHQLRRVFHMCRFSRELPKLVVVSHPCHYSFRDLVEGARAVAYDCYDHFGFMGSDRRDFALERLENKLAASVDFILASGCSLTERLIKENRRTYDFPQAVDRQRFSLKKYAVCLIPREIRHMPRPWIGFCGCLKSTDNIELLERVIRLRPAWTFVLIAEVSSPVAARFNNILRLPNVYNLGWRNPERLPGYLRSFDAGLMISRVNELTDTFSPYKLFEYLGADIPVVSTRIREALRYKGVIEFGDTPEEFVAALERCLHCDRDALSRRIRALVETENWDQRARLVLALFREQLQSSQYAVKERSA